MLQPRLWEIISSKISKLRGLTMKSHPARKHSWIGPIYILLLAAYWIVPHLIPNIVNAQDKTLAETSSPETPFKKRIFDRVVPSQTRETTHYALYLVKAAAKPATSDQAASTPPADRAVMMSVTEQDLKNFTWLKIQRAMPNIGDRKNPLTGLAQSNGVIIGEGLLKKLNLRLGSPLIITLIAGSAPNAQQPEDTTRSNKLPPLRVQAIFTTDNPDYNDNLIILPQTQVEVHFPGVRPQLDQWADDQEMKSLDIKKLEQDHF